MPTYVYKFVETGETIEVHQGFHDDPLTAIAHPDSGEVLAVKKVFTPVGVSFKGSGFFKTDNRGKKTAASTSTTKSDGDSGSSSSDSASTSGSSSTKTSSDTSGSTSSSSSSTDSSKGSSGSSSSGSSSKPSS